MKRRRAPRLQCVCLNGCETADLGYQIVSQLPWVMCICWATLTEDTAARAFAQVRSCAPRRPGATALVRRTAPDLTRAASLI